MDPIEYYNKYAARIFEDTVDQDMTEIAGRFLEHLEEGATILDLGCGSGRDSLAFYEAGYDVTPLDASEEMCKLAEIHTGLDVLCMSAEEMDFEEVFDGIWACASLVHIPKGEMPEILGRIRQALKQDGILYMSFKKGDFEGARGERYFSDYTEESLRQLMESVPGFELEEIWESEDVRSGHQDKLWVNVLVKKK